MEESPIQSYEELMAEELGIPLPEEPKKEKKKTNNDDIIYTSFIETPEYILEQIKNTTHTTHTTLYMDSQYLKFDKSTGMIEKIPNFLYKNKEYRPITNQIFEKNIILLPTGIEEYGTTNDLIKQIKKFFSNYFEPPKFFDNFLPYLCLFYWVYEKFPFIPYAHFVGRTATGKTTAMEVFGSICYKPIDVSSSITMASMFRIATEWGGTLLIDEFDQGVEGYRAMVAFLKSGVSDRSVLRTEGDKKREVIPYLIKSPKVFTSENPVTTAGLQSRTITIKMEKNKRKIPLYRLGGFHEEAKEIRNKLLLWRMRNLGKIDLKKIEYGFKALSKLDRRVQQVITPIYYLSNKDAKKDILCFAKEHQEETLRERRESLDGVVFQVISEVAKTGVVELPTVLEEVNKINISNGFKPITSRKLGNIIRKILGFDIKREGQNNISTVKLEKTKVKELCAYYGVLEFIVSVERVERVADETIQDIFGDIVEK